MKQHRRKMEFFFGVAGRIVKGDDDEYAEEL